MITFKPAPTQFVQRVYIKNYLLGTFEMLDDGYWHYCFPSIGTGGLISASILRDIATKLDELNEPWDRIVHQQLSKAEDGLIQFEEPVKPEGTDGPA